MTYIKIFLNISIGVIIAVSGAVALFSMLAIFKNLPSSTSEFLVSSSAFAGSLVLAYFLNKPKEGPVIKAFYNTKWWLGLSVSFALLVGFACFLFVSNQEVLSLPILPAKGSGYTTLGELIIMLISFACLVFLGRAVWRCPKCQERLPFLTEGKTSKVGLGIKVCPSCKVKVADA
ncbi:hypothetical protein GCM10008090_24700 [Arenicella chitinivorans]|uniref:Uncharacterized protein n=1 Tax=Arenicella chitinivorans TaxID=1329800 RepID=A0A918VMX5_9GAMM|nr:hypothetical protein [Arenicella chitinivorans]GHA13982.1 hypothetical protein GCM10008090_24700 [Arenicella chitinivorans]